MSEADLITQMMFPTVIAPREGELEPAEKSGTRYVAATDGLWREVTLPWIRVLHKIAPSVVTLPYGRVDEAVVLELSAVPKVLRQQFFRDAVAAMPKEMAAAMIWNAATGDWRYEMRKPRFEARDDHIDYWEVELEADEYLVLDLHSHGTFEAFFSKEDNDDDAGSMKFSGVLGSLSDDEPSSVMRLSMLGKTWNARFASNGKLEVISC